MEASAVAIAVAQAVIQAMTTELWTSIRPKIAKILAGRRPHDRVLGELEATAELVRGAPQARPTAEQKWAHKIDGLLTADPHIEVDLHRLAEEITRALDTVAPRGEVRQVAIAGQDAVQIGNSNITIQHPAPHPAPQPGTGRRRWWRW